MCLWQSRIILVLIMVFLTSLFGKRNHMKASGAMASPNAATAASSSSSSSSNGVSTRPSMAELEDRLKGALWGFFAGDALASPTHWYYGGRRQIMADYGGRPIADYTKPNTKLVGSILNKSNLNGGGRSSTSGNKKSGNPLSIVGDVINHGKKHLWSPTKSIHYHATLQKGENTLEVQIARVLMRSMTATGHGGQLDPHHFRQAYMDFMTTPGSHNDTYASTCHRMFFANLVHRNLPPEQCPDNDHHNVDTVDGLVLPTIAAMANPRAAARCAAVTRQSAALERVSDSWGRVVHAALVQSNDEAFMETLGRFSQRTIRRPPNPSVVDDRTLSACYLAQALPGLIDLTAKYLALMPPKTTTTTTTTTTTGATPTTAADDYVWQALLANANVGGENVHRGSVMGAILGARAGYSRLSAPLVQGLVPRQQLAEEIDAFCKAVLPSLHRQAAAGSCVPDDK